MPITITNEAIPPWINMEAIADPDLRSRVTTLTMELSGDLINLRAKIEDAVALIAEVETSQPDHMHLAGPVRDSVRVNDATGLVWSYFSGVHDLNRVLCDIADLCGSAVDGEIAEVSK